MALRIRVALTIGLAWLAMAHVATARDWRPLWEGAAAGAVVDAVAGGARIVVATADEVCAYQASDGARAWCRPAPGVRSLAADARDVWTADASGVTRCRAADGAEAARIDLPGEEKSLAPAPVRGRLAVGVGDSTWLLAADELTVVGKYDESLFHGHADLLRQTGHWRARFDPDAGRVYFVEGRALTGVDLRTGQRVFTEAGRRDLTGWPTVYDGRVFVPATQKLRCFTTDGKTAWTVRLRFPKEPLPVMLPGRPVDIDVPPPPLFARIYRWGERIGRGQGVADLLTLRNERGLVYLTASTGATKMSQPLPDGAMPLVDVGTSVYWITLLTGERSALTKFDKRSHQLFGREVTAGTPSGFFVMGPESIVLESAPGVVARYDQAECTIEGHYEFAGDRLATMCAAGERLVVVTRAGRLAAFDLR